MADTSPPEVEEADNFHLAAVEVTLLQKEEEGSPLEEVEGILHYPSLGVAYRQSSSLERNSGEGPRTEEDRRTTSQQRDLGVGRAVDRLVELVEGVRLVVGLPRVLLVSARR